MLSGFFFAYTLIILFVCGAAAIMSLTASIVVRSRVSIPQALMFMFYIADLAVIFQNEWFLQNEPFDISTYYDVPDAAWRILFSAAFIWCIWAILLDSLDRKHAFAQALVPTVLFAVASAASLLLPYGAFRQWLFYSLRQFFLIAGLAYVFVQTWKKNGRGETDLLVRKRGVAIAALVLLIAILIEDSIVILVVPPQDVSLGIMLYLSERNFSENITIVALALMTIRQNVAAIRAR